MHGSLTQEVAAAVINLLKDMTMVSEREREREREDGVGNCVVVCYFLPDSSLRLCAGVP